MIYLAFFVFVLFLVLPSFLCLWMIYKIDELEKLIMGTVADPLAAITSAVSDLTTAVATETGTLNSVLAKLTALAAQPTVSPTEVAALAAQIEASVGNLNTANTAAQAVLNPPAASSAAPAAPASSS